MPRSKQKLSGITLMIRASFAFSLMVLGAKITSRTLPVFEIVFFRSLIGTLLITSVIFAKRASIFGQRYGIMIIRGVSGFLALALHFYVIARLPLGTAVLLNYTAPVFAAILAILFLKERPGILLISMILVSFSGLFLLVQARFHEWNFTVMLGLISAMFAAITHICIRIVKQRESPLTIIFYFTGISTVASAFLLPLGFEWPDWKEWFWLIEIGVTSFYAQLWMTIALRRAPASLVSPFLYLTPVLSYFYGLIFFGESLNRTSVIGVFLIILGGSLVTYFETKAKTIAPGEV